MLMKSAWIVAAVLLFAATAGFAAPPAPFRSPVPDLAVLLGPPTLAAACAVPQSEVRLAAKRPARRPNLEKALCTATVVCDSGTVLSCEGNSSSTSCSAVDRDCSVFQQGSVTCDGVTTLCPTVCPCDDTRVCCKCDRTGDCMACCRCAGGTFSECNAECY
jgi:hypothetical protein